MQLIINTDDAKCVYFYFFFAKFKGPMALPDRGDTWICFRIEPDTRKIGSRRFLYTICVVSHDDFQPMSRNIIQPSLLLLGNISTTCCCRLNCRFHFCWFFRMMPRLIAVANHTILVVKNSSSERLNRRSLRRQVTRSAPINRRSVIQSGSAFKLKLQIDFQEIIIQKAVRLHRVGRRIRLLDTHGSFFPSWLYSQAAWDCVIICVAYHYGQAGEIRLIRFRQSATSVLRQGYIVRLVSTSFTLNKKW